MQLSPQTKVKTKVSNRLVYAASGVALIGALIIGWLIYFNIGDQEDAVAGTSGPAPVNDTRSAALPLTDLYEYESAAAAFTNVDATSDAVPSCFSGAEQGVWFKFSALYESGTITIKTGGGEGTAQWLEAALETSSGSNVACTAATAANDDITLTFSGLTIDQDYYLLVDTKNPADAGTFTVYINNVSPVKFYSRKKGDWDDKDTWSTSGYNGPKASNPPSKSNVVFIKDVNGEIKVKNSAECAGLFIESDNDESELRIQPHRSLSVYGRFEINNYNHKSVGFELKNGGKLYVQSDWLIHKHNGWEDLDITLEGDSVIVDGNMTVEHSNGKGVLFELKDGSLTVGGNLKFSQSGGYGGDEYVIEENVFVGGNWIFTKSNGSGNRKFEITKNRAYHVQGNWIAQASGGSGQEDFNMKEGTLQVDGNLEMEAAGGSGDYKVEFEKMDISVGGYAYFQKTNGSRKYVMDMKDETSLSVTGDLVHRFQSGSQNYDLTLEDKVTVNVGGDYYIEKTGGNNRLKVDVKDEVSITIAGNSNLLHSSGSSGMDLRFVDHASFSSSGDLTMEWTGGSNPFTFEFGDGSGSNQDTLRVGGDLNFGSTTGWSGSYRLDAEINRSAIVFVGGDIEAIHSRGRLNFKNDDTELVLNGSSQQQIVGESTGVLFVDYRHIEVNNSYTNPDSTQAFGIELMGEVNLESELILTLGTIRTTHTHILQVDNTGQVTGGNTQSFVDGPMKIEGNNSLFFPVGRYSFYAPIEIHNQSPNSNSNLYLAEYFPEDYGDPTTGPGLNNVSSVEHWEFEQLNGNADIEYELYWYDNERSGISDLNDLTIALYDSTTSQWENIGPVMTSGTLETGSIRSTTRQGQFGPATFGSVGGGNILPIELAYFNATLNDRKTVDLEWSTYIEINNDYFTLERSNDGRQWEEIGQVTGAGNSDSQLDYYFEDKTPYPGNNLYRLKQTDYNGDFEYFDVRQVEVPINENAALQVVKAAPNPFSNATTLEMQALAEGTIQLMVQNTSGQIIFQDVISVREGQNTYQLQGSDWMPGIYLVTLYQGEQRSVAFKLIKAQ